MPPKRKIDEGNSQSSDISNKQTTASKSTAPDNSTFQFVPVKTVQQTKDVSMVDVAKDAVELKIKNNYPTFFRNTSADKRSELFTQVVDEENRYRELFAQERDSPLLDGMTKNEFLFQHLANFF